MDLSSFRTNNAKEMTAMFSGCSSIQFIKNINFVNKKIESTFNIFNDCKSIEHLNLEKFRTDNVTNMMCMFIIALN